MLTKKNIFTICLVLLIALGGGIISDTIKLALHSKGDNPNNSHMPDKELCLLLEEVDDDVDNENSKLLSDVCAFFNHGLNSFISTAICLLITGSGFAKHSPHKTNFLRLRVLRI